MNSSANDSDLALFLEQRGYTRLSLECNVVGHFELSATLNGSPIRLLLDTGASRTVMDRQAADRLGLAKKESSELAGGVGTSDHAVESSEIETLGLGDIELGPRSAFVMDLSHVNQALSRHGGTPIDGALGGDILRPREAIIDYARSALYLRKVAS